MVSTALYYRDPRYRADSMDGYSGVVMVTHAGYLGSGALLQGGRAVLTAAHLFYEKTGTTRVYFDTIDGRVERDVERVLLHPAYDPDNANNDLALVWLSQPAPVAANRYGIYRGNDEIGRTFELVGYGRVGTGFTGTLDDWTEQGFPVRLRGFNQFDADAGELKAALGRTMTWTPQTGHTLVADFDSGRLAHDALGGLLGRRDLGLGLLESLISPGDSGGPALIGGTVAGVASYGASLATYDFDPDIDFFANNGSFGELGFWQRTSVHQQWIDQALRREYPNVPRSPQEVQKQVPEGNNDTRYAYFLVQFNGQRGDSAPWVSVDFATRDGTAKQGEDYLPVRGTLVLYPEERQAVIPVEIIGDRIPEQNEYFYLDIFNPVGGDFGAGVQILTATRWIVDDDGYWV